MLTPPGESWVDPFLVGELPALGMDDGKAVLDGGCGALTGVFARVSFGE